MDEAIADSLGPHPSRFSTTLGARRGRARHAALTAVGGLTTIPSRRHWGASGMSGPTRGRIWNPVREVAAFVDGYRAWMLTRYGLDSLPRPGRIEHGVLHNFRPWEHFMVLRHADFDPGQTVLDTGAMHTYFCLYVAPRVRRIVVTDSFYWYQREYNRRQRLWEPRAWCAYVESKHPGRLTAEQADLTRLPYRDCAFDRVLSVGTIEHVQDDQQGLLEMFRVLRPGGRLLLTTEYSTYQPRPYTEADGSWMRVYGGAELLDRCTRAGFRLLAGPYAEQRTVPLLRRKSDIFLSLERPT